MAKRKARRKAKVKLGKQSVSRNGYPIAKVKGRWVRIEDQTPPYYAVPGRYGTSWDYMGEGLVRQAPYDEEGMAQVRKLGGLKWLIDHTNPHLNPQRKRLLLERIAAISHARQRIKQAADTDQHRARRLTRKERGKLWKAKAQGQDALKNLKALLSKR